MPRGLRMLLQQTVCSSLVRMWYFFMIWGNQMVFGWWMRCDWVCESWFFFLVFSYSQPKYRLTTLFRCLSLLSFACFVHALLFSLFIFIIISMVECRSIGCLLSMHMSQFMLISIPIFVYRFCQIHHAVKWTHSSNLPCWFAFVRSARLIGWLGANVCVYHVASCQHSMLKMGEQMYVEYQCRFLKWIFQVAKISHASNTALAKMWMNWMMNYKSVCSQSCYGKCVNVADWEIDRQMLNVCVCLVGCAYLVFFSNLNYLKKLPFSSGLVALWNFIYSKVLTFVCMQCGCVDVAMKSYFPF